MERCIISDITVEAVAPILLENPRGVLSASDELATWLGSFDRYANGKGDAAHWLSMHSGESIVVDRKTGQPRTIFVRAAAVSICGGIQPGILHRALGSEHRENGLLARLLLACPPREQKRWTEAEIDPFVEQQYAALIDGLAALEPTEDDEGEPCPVVLRLTPEAKAVWQEFYNAHAAEQANLIGDLAAAWSKLEETAARLALVICCIRVASAAPPAKPWATDNPIPQPAEVNADDMRRAVRLTEWFKHETQRVYSILGESDEERRKRELVDLIRLRGGTIAPRELMQASRQFRESAEVAEAALGGLVKDGIGAWEAQPPGPQGGRPARVFRLYDSGNGNTNPETSEENEVPLPLPQGNGETEKRNRQPGCVSGPSPLNDGSMTCSA